MPQQTSVRCGTSQSSDKLHILTCLFCDSSLLMLSVTQIILYILNGFCLVDPIGRNHNFLSCIQTERDEKRKEHLEEIFMNCSRFELGFWNRAWLGEKETL